MSIPQQLQIAANALRAVSATDRADPGDQQAVLRQLPMILAGLQRAVVSAGRAARPATTQCDVVERLATAKERLCVLLLDAAHAAEVAGDACSDLLTRDEYVLTRELAIARAGVGEAAFEVRLSDDPEHGPRSEYTYDFGAAHYLAIRRAEQYPPSTRIEIWRVGHKDGVGPGEPDATIKGLFDTSDAG